MMIPTLRIMTRKSKMGFGKHKDRTVQRMIDLGKKIDLISAYYKLTSISYNEDVLNELKITEEYRIKKPSSDRDMYYKFLKENGFSLKLRNRDGANKMQVETRPYSKSYLQRKNQGN